MGGDIGGDEEHDVGKVPVVSADEVTERVLLAPHVREGDAVVHSSQRHEATGCVVGLVVDDDEQAGGMSNLKRMSSSFVCAYAATTATHVGFAPVPR
eukprot:CAMPEP_0182823972 /NCGR_PEP_ID=MMETSP0006_2-20121128/15042_1 /TAXON_ID=97485 /ORGANISM="Prymnesium parvum, Strain Texoma1" /LENGTH=96 /DNA_ID=CAMNT_0024950939 /DNA_START=692 /DNA_END=983 /DNA_ORIENTATION=-